ncbi:KR domain-domain-containing protein [Clohesyomyces aquaticus]|uniref:KR domain-domain-containing protein n=1 Tax=Clohesyomyces aquaticus TaxID=1231657 RepID=A0A1Y1Y9B0_9PLEO|nr:KR domain-domain-containing protein [Clohesyomyces aquaticus]
MSVDAWHQGIDAQVKGVWNLHKALEGRDQDLDFFLMTSSIAGSIGTARERSYCAANSFLDWFARNRRALGLPATSIGLEMIRDIIDIWLTPEADTEEAPFICGLELLGLERIRQLGFERPTHVLSDPRCGVIAGTFTQAEEQGALDGAGRGANQPGSTLGRLSTLFDSRGILRTVQSDGQAGEQIFEIVEHVVKDKISGLLLLPPHELSSAK